MENQPPVTVYPLEADPTAGRAFGPPPGGPPPVPTEPTAFGADPAPDTYLPPSGTPPGQPRQGLKTWLAATLAAMVFGLGGFFGIQAVTHHSHTTTTAAGPGGGSFPAGGPGGNFPGPGGPRFGDGPGTFGTITSISGSTLTLGTRDSSTVTVTTSSSTTVTKAAPGTVSDIATGDHVAVQGNSASGGTAADRVTDSKTGAVPVTGGPNGSDVSGTVTSVGTGTFTVTDDTGATATVTTSSATTVTVIQPSRVSGLAVGDTVVVTGTATNGTVAATSIQSGAVRPFGPGGGPGRGFGGPPSA